MKRDLKPVSLVYYLLFFLAAQALLLFFLHYKKSCNETEYTARIIDNRVNEYRSILASYDRLVHVVFDEVIDKPNVISLLKDASLLPEAGRTVIRRELYEKLLPSYNRLKKNIVRQVHFHFPDGRSFLRMHKPNDFGDKLFEVRDSIRIANEEKRVASGFEEGRHYHAFRHIFPVFFQGEHVGSVGLSVPFYILKSALVDGFPAEYFFIIKKGVVEKKLFLKERHNYQTSTISPEFMVEKADISRQICMGKGHENCLMEGVVHSINQEIKEEISSQLMVEKPFANWVTLDGFDYCAVFIPVANVMGETVGYLYSYFRDSSLSTIRKNYYLTYGISTILILLLLCLYRWSTNTIVAQNRFLHTTIESFPYPFYVIDVKDHSILLANSMAASSGNWHGKTCHEHSHNQDSPCVGGEHICPLQEVVRTKKPVMVEHNHGDGYGGERIFEVYGSPIFDQNNNVIQMIEYSVDITPRKEAETAKEKLEFDLRQARKSEAVGTMAGGIAHHFNNILGAILGYAEFAQADMPVDSSAHNDIARVIASANRARELVRHITTLSDKKDFSEEPCSPFKILITFLNSKKLEIPASIILKQDIEQANEKISLDYYHFTEIIKIMAVNAFESMTESKGTITVSLKNVHNPKTDHNACEIVAATSFVQLSISDTGCGIPKDDLERIFDPFYTTKDVGEGEGIGLAILQGIVTRNGGRIKVESEVGKGTRFDIFLPVVRS